MEAVTFTSNARTLKELNSIRRVGSCVWVGRLTGWDVLNTPLLWLRAYFRLLRNLN
jgi:hypothetical protein